MRRLVRTGAVGTVGRSPALGRGAERPFGSLPFFNIVETTLREGEQRLRRRLRGAVRTRDQMHAHAYGFRSRLYVGSCLEFPLHHP